MEELGSILKWEATPQPVSPDPRAVDDHLHVKYNVGYIVAAVVWNSDKEVLLIQEAKASCRGQWYLPAGRAEPNETMLEAVRREVLEESGLEFEPEAVLMLEHNSHGSWIRITFVGRITGGSLKTTAQADKESLQAGWFSSQKLETTPIRHRDIDELIAQGKVWYYGDKKHRGLPPAVGHTCVSRRLVLVHKGEGELYVLVRRPGAKGVTRFPVCRMGRDEMKASLKACGYVKGFELKGLLSLEHLGKPYGKYDGMCFSMLLTATSKELKDKSEYCWETVDASRAEMLTKALDDPIPIVSFGF